MKYKAFLKNFLFVGIGVAIAFAAIEVAKKYKAMKAEKETENKGGLSVVTNEVLSGTSENTGTQYPKKTVYGG